MSGVFFPRDVAFVKARAKSLRSAAPWLSHAAALETTSISLGFVSWFDASKRIGSLPPSPADEEVGSVERLWRRYHQGCALVDVAGFAPADADTFVRYWCLTAAQHIFKISDFRSAYGDACDELAEYQAAVDAGELSDPDDWGYSGPPERLTEDLIVTGGDSKHRYYVPSEDALAQIPLCLRGNAAAFLEFEDARALAFARPDWFDRTRSADGREFMKQYGGPRVAWIDPSLLDEHAVDIRRYASEARDHPDALFPLALRWTSSGKVPPDRFFVPVVTGNVFHRFLTSGGELQFRDVQWLAVRQGAAAPYVGTSQIFPGDVPESFRLSPQTLKSLETCLPPYLSPFKHGPMFAHEYSPVVEGGHWPLSLELKADTDR